MSGLKFSLGVLLCWSLLPGMAAAQAPADRPDDLDRMLAQAVDMQQAGDLLGAVDTYRIVLQSMPDRADVRSNLGAAYVKLGRFDEGMEQYREAIRLDPVNASYRFNLALALYKAIRPVEAIPEFRRASTFPNPTMSRRLRCCGRRRRNSTMARAAPLSATRSRSSLCRCGSWPRMPTSR